MENKVTLTMKAQHTLKMEMDYAGGSGMVGVPPIVVSRILGHSKPSDTLDIYGHLYHEM